jgi:hypothetical protein
MKINQYNKVKYIPAILELLSKEYIIDENCIKVWSCDTMVISDVLRGIKYVRSIGKNIIVFTNKVNHKERLSSDFNIKILDIEDITNLLLEHKKYELL